jgi:hypothetical protein
MYAVLHITVQGEREIVSERFTMLQRSLTQMEEEESKIIIIQQQLKQQVCTLYTILYSAAAVTVGVLQGVKLSNAAYCFV